MDKENPNLLEIIKLLMSHIQLKNIVWQEENHYVAQCLNVEVSSFGSTKEEAISNLTEALELYFEDATTDQPILKHRLIIFLLRLWFF
ncbi:MAG: type II toxin-antitoxin system HicB family antitoxin [Chitinophagaceae bacterium]